MKVTKRQLRRIIREELTAGQKSDFRTVYDALWSLYTGDMNAALDQEAKNRTVEEHGWTWDQYIQKATEQVEEMEKQMALSMQSAKEEWDEYPEQLQASREAADEERDY